MESASKAVHGLNLAILILSILGIVSCLIGFACTGVITSVLFGYSDEIATSIDESIESGNGHFEGDNGSFTYDGDIDIDADTLQAITDSGLSTSDVVGGSAAIFAAFVSALLVVSLIITIYSLIASIVAFRNSRKPDKLKVPFVLAIIGAVLNILSCALITGILFIISAVYINKVRKLAPAATAAAMPEAEAEAPVPPTAE